ncbi:Nramp family divalent metal transporter [Riemerella anatipestifer]|uniref:Nramp family divalent metal transporter n=1 Tax=Riemerella anatipestifer TaxID=34085 RepID=UPI001BD96132|nr:Nramp family divalent metal transporter [Riemerella anatipestifer]MBT0551870.1 Nramp family divalent metal transporter [Riemerella anatipestifer]MBT0554046.1 Nramp family divalent metal transporter [Riemerella anatipestifer]MCE3024645.1 Nramp family divalent metal transporter [Riemerella anatipestifer]MCU7560318.1 Nramp family divalent metal transporter [Riemerella anatipestifer]MDY3449596.1 Nramp family divalent metal transporter [Riemerella anatipestifer]
MKKYFRDRAWKKERSGNSLSESFSSIEVPKDAGFWRKFLAFVGPGLMVAVGYMDPGNWATGIAGGAKFGYTLLSVILISNLFAMLLQHLSLKLGIVAERDLAQACRDSYSRPVNFLLWIFAEIAIAATDLAEVIGAAIALNLLFGLPLTVGIAITVVDVFVILMLQAKGFRWLESVVGGLIAVIFLCFLYETVVSNPEWFPILKGLVPQKEIVFNPSMLYIAIGILGATVMPHNLYLHSSIVQTRNYSRDDVGKREAIKFATLDSNISLLLAFFINAAILIVSSAAFHHTGYQDVADITDAHQLLSPILGTSLASIVFAMALLASGQNSTLTGTLAGQIVMEGFLNIKLKPWLRRLITRLIAVIPALVVAIIYGEKGTADLLILSQVILSLQLSFAVVPLVMLTNNKLKMGVFANQGFLKYAAIIISFIIVVLNIYLVYTEIV